MCQCMREVTACPCGVLAVSWWSWITAHSVDESDDATAAAITPRFLDTIKHNSEKRDLLQCLQQTELRPASAAVRQWGAATAVQRPLTRVQERSEWILGMLWLCLHNWRVSRDESSNTKFKKKKKTVLNWQLFYLIFNQYLGTLIGMTTQDIGIDLILELYWYLCQREHFFSNIFLELQVNSDLATEVLLACCSCRCKFNIV